MKIRRAKHSGFCFGVRRAIDIAKKTAAKEKNTYIIGDIVHNEIVTKKILSWGIKKVPSLDKIPEKSTVIFKAHGTPLALYKQAQKRKLKIVDATCPMVTEIHRKAKELEKEGYQIVIVGDKKHEEVTGIRGHLNKSLVIENKLQAQNAVLKRKKTALICQSTQNIDNAAAILEKLAKKTDRLLFLNTICSATRNRQKEVKKTAQDNEAVIIVGSKKSANTKRLYQVAKKINKNSFWVQTENDIATKEFKKFSSIGIIGGASTPSQILNKIYYKLKQANDF